MSDKQQEEIKKTLQRSITHTAHLFNIKEDEVISIIKELY